MMLEPNGHHVALARHAAAGPIGLADLVAAVWFPSDEATAMVWQLVEEGVLGYTPGGTVQITDVGRRWLTEHDPTGH
jgi:hypothetical protein